MRTGTTPNRTCRDVGLVDDAHATARPRSSSSTKSPSSPADGAHRGVRLNFPESIAVITEALLEAARDGRSVAEVIELGKQVLTRADVMDGVPEMVTLVQVEATFRTGTQLVIGGQPHP